MGLWEKSTALLLAERDCASLFVHAFNDSERFQMDAFFAQLIAAGLEAFFNYDARTDQGCTGGFYQGSKLKLKEAQSPVLTPPNLLVTI